MTDLRTYYYELEQQHAAIENAANLFETLIPEGDDAELAATDYSGTAYNLWASVLTNERLQKIHKLFRMTKEQLIQKSQGETAPNYTVYEVRSYDTIHSVARKFNVSIEDILRANNITASEFEDQTEILIPQLSTNVITVYENVPTFDTHNGIKVLGTDLSADCTVDANGDLKVLDEVDSFHQGVTILINTEAGTIPLEDGFGGAPKIGKEYPQEIISNMITVNLLNSLSQDGRIKDVNNIILEKQNQGDYLIKADAIPINSDDYRKAIEQ